MTKSVFRVIGVVASIVVGGAAGGYMVNKMLFDNWLSPSMDKQQEKRNAVFAEKPNTITKQILTDKGDTVYTVENEDGTDTIMSKSQIVAEQADPKTTRKRMAKLQSGLEGGALQQVFAMPQE